MCGEAHSHNNCPKKEERTPKCANCRGPHVANYRGCPAYKDQAFRQHVIHKKVSASILKLVSPLPPNNTFNFTAEKIVSLVTNVVIQIAQPQLCTKNLPEKQIPSVKTDHRNREKMLFDSIISRPVPPPPAPFVFSSTPKASTVLNKAASSLASSSLSCTKSTKTPSLGSQRKSSFKLSPQQNKTSSTKPSPTKPST